MSHFECRLNRRFWRSKKVVKVLQIGVRGSKEMIWTKSKRTATFFVKPSLRLARIRRIVCGAKSRKRKKWENNRLSDVGISEK